MAGRRRHFGAIRKLPSGRYQARYRGPDGVMRPARETFERKQDAAAWLSSIEAEITAGTWRDPARTDERLQDYAERWIAERPNLRPRTVELYRWLLGRHVTPHLGNLALADLDGNPAVIRSWRAALLDSGISPSMTAKAYRLLRAVLMTAAEDDEIIRRNPCRIRGAGTETAPERPTLTVDQAAALAAQMPARYSALVLLATYASLRWGEVTAVRRTDLDLNSATIRVRRAYTELSTGRLILGPPKSRAGVRVVAFPRGLVPLLRRHLDDYAEPGDGLIFTGPKGGPLRRSTFNRLVRSPRAVEAVGAPRLHFHDLRHTGNQLAAQVPGTTVRDLMARMGHDNERAAMI